MPREGAIIFRELIGKLEVLDIECDKCGRRGRYHLHRLIERYGIDAKLFDCRTRSRRIAHESRRTTSTISAVPGARICQRWSRF